MFTGIIEEIGTVIDFESTGEATLPTSNNINNTASIGGATATSTSPSHHVSARVTIKGHLVTEDAQCGDSISVNGVCLTIVDLPKEGRFTADVMPETLKRSTLGNLHLGSQVNLERALTLGDRLGGHIVQGHVDGVGIILNRKPGIAWDDIQISAPPELMHYIAEKGSIAVCGVSLTVTKVGDGFFGVSLVPITLESTILGNLAEGSKVNLEVDVLSKYVERLMRPQI